MTIQNQLLMLSSTMNFDDLILGFDLALRQPNSITYVIKTPNQICTVPNYQLRIQFEIQFNS